MQLERLFAYDDWANREEVARLRQLAAPAPGLRILGHIVGAEALWLSRVRAEAARLAVWPELSLDQCEAELNTLRDGWQGVLGIERLVQYRNSKGELWTSTMDEVLTHVVMHSAYHRGQIATLVRQGGETPAYTDLIHAARNKFI